MVATRPDPPLTPRKRPPRAPHRVATPKEPVGTSIYFFSSATNVFGASRERQEKTAAPPGAPRPPPPHQWGPLSCHDASAGARRQAGPACRVARRPRPRRPLQPRRAQEGLSAGKRRPPSPVSSPQRTFPAPTKGRPPLLGRPPRHGLRALPPARETSDGQPLGGGCGRGRDGGVCQRSGGTSA